MGNEMRFMHVAAFVIALIPVLVSDGHGLEILDSANPQVKGQALDYQSSFANPQIQSEPGDMPWRDANDTARQLGGHTGQIRGEDTVPATRRPEAGGPNTKPDTKTQ
jgi:hypothetical protein